MKIVLDCVVKDKDKYVAYIQLHDEEGSILHNAIVHYEEGKTEDLKQIAVDKFRDKVRDQMAKEKKMLEIRSILESALGEIDLEKEVT